MFDQLDLMFHTKKKKYKIKNSTQLNLTLKVVNLKLN